MHKLDHEEDLRSIIESKLKSGSNSILNSSYQPHLKEKRNQSYITDYTEDQNQQLALKLRQCENEVFHFRAVIREMSESTLLCYSEILELTKEKKTNGRNREIEANCRLSSCGTGEDAGFQYGATGTGNSRQSYRECYRNEAKSIGTQVDSGTFEKKDKERSTIQSMEKEKGRTKEREVSSSDFFDNL